MEVERKLKLCGRCLLPKVIWKAKTRSQPQMCQSCFNKEPKERNLIEEAGVHLKSIDDSQRKIKKIIANLKPKNQSKVKTGTITLSELLKQTEKVFNAWIRRRDTHYDRTFKCICCSKWFPVSEMDAGHYMGVRYAATRFDEMNVHGSCQACNSLLYGNLVPYRENLVIKFGEEAVVNLEYRARLPHKWNREVLTYLIEKYK